MSLINVEVDKIKIKNITKKIQTVAVSITDHRWKRELYYFNETCQKTVPQAIVCALEATDFEDAIRNAISIGGDSDTVGAITGSIAEAIFGVPDEIVLKARSYLSDEINSVVDHFNERLEAKSD